MKQLLAAIALSLLIPLQVFAATITTLNTSDNLGTWRTTINTNFSNLNAGLVFPFTPQTYGVSTSTTIGFLGSLFTTGSTTISNLLSSYSTTTNATTTSLFSTTASSTNLFSQSAQLGSLVIGSLTGVLKASSGTVSAAANGTDYTLLTATTCSAGQHVSALTASGGVTCSADSGGLQAVAVDSGGWVSSTSTVWGGLNAQTSGTTYGFAIGDALVGYASSTNRTTIFGLQAGNSATTTNTSNLDVAAFGYQALQSVTSGTLNNGFGVGAAQFTTSGASNSAFGTVALGKNITGSHNIAIGLDSSLWNGSATNTVAIGDNAASGNTGPIYGAQGYTSVGYQSGFSFQTGADYNTLLGYQAGYGVTTGAKNIYVGAFTTNTNANVSSGSNNVVIGNDIKVPSGTQSNQLNIQNIFWGSGNSATGLVPSTGTAGIGSTTPWARFAIHANNGDTNTTLFAIGSSTASATTTLFAISNTGSTTLGNFGTCSGSKALTLDANSNVVCGSISSSGVTAVTATWPVISSGGTTPNITWGGLATTSSPTAGNLFYSNGTTGLVPVATSSPTNGTGITLSGTGSVVGGSLSITNSSPLSGLSATFPFSFSNPTLTWTGLATSSNIANTQVLVGTAANTFTSYSTLTYGSAGSLLTLVNGTSTAFTVGSFFAAPNQSSSPSNTVAGSVVVNTNGNASSSVAIGDGSTTHNLFALQSKGGVFASSTLAYMGAFGSAGTTTIGLPLDIHKQTIRSIRCYTDVGTAWVGFGTGSATTTELQCSTTASSVSVSSNNTFNGSQIGYIEIGHSASSPNRITVSADIEDSN